METFFASLNSIPEESIAVAVYLIGSMIALWCWYRIAIRLPRLLGGVTWLFMFCILLTPTVSAGNNASLAPAIFGLIFGVLTQEKALVWSNLSYMLFTFGLGLLVGYCWHKFRQSDSNKSHKHNTAL